MAYSGFKRRILFLILLFSFVGVFSQNNSLAENTDWISGNGVDTVVVDSVKKMNFFQKIVHYISDNKSEPAPQKGIRWSILGGPYYSNDEKFSIAVNGTANYRTNGCGLDVQPSFTSLYGSISTAGFWKAGVFGTTIFKNDAQRLNFDVVFSYQPRNYWGIGYEAACNDTAYVNLKQKMVKLQAEYVFALKPQFYVGPAVEWDYNIAGKDVDLEYLRGQDRTIRNLGLGFVVQYDTRDLITNASQGVYFHLKSLFFPKFMDNKYAFTMLDFTTSYYHSLWRDATICGQINAKFNFGNPSWAAMSLFGDDYVMRGYYRGRFRDKHMTSAQVELRQHVWRRNGIVVWAGVGNVFHDGESFKKLLPNYGIGYRWEFRKKMNVRLDYGMGSHGQSAVVFSINEAF